MPCPRCRSHNLWDDNLAWGCHDCDFFTTGEVQNRWVPEDRFNNEWPLEPPKKEPERWVYVEHYGGEASNWRPPAEDDGP